MEQIEELFKSTIDEVIEEFTDNPNAVFNGLNERAALFFPLLQRYFSAWKQSKKCIYKNCNELSIAKSHTISKSSFLSNIAEDGHVYTPTPDIKTGAPKIIKVGLNEASTFPGFCKTHELLFQKFEQSGSLQENSDLFLQVYRTICREVVIKEHRIKMIEAFNNQYIIHRNARLLSKLDEKPFIQFLKSTGMESKSLNYEGFDPLEEIFRQEIKQLKKQNNEFIKTFYNKIQNELDNTRKSSFSGVKITVDEQLPVALAGRGSFDVYDSKKGKQRKIEVILNVIPETTKTLVNLFCIKKDKAAVELYVNEYLKQHFGILNMIEAWMVYGSDHWFLKPSVWENITAENQSFFTTEIQNLKVNIATNNPKTFFNDLRRKSLSTLQSTMSDSDYMKLWNSEKKKFSN